MKKVFMFLIILVFGLCLPVFTSAEMPEENPLLPNSLIPGMIEGTGTHFEVTASEYLNIVLDSSEAVTLRLESVPEMVTMHIESATDVASTQITISGFQPLTAYYKYEDDYHNEEIFTTDENGKYSYIQDLSKPHLIFIQPRASTKYINATGGDCYLIGNWDWATRTCILTTDVYETIQIESNYITLDGNGYTITGTGTGYGIVLFGREGITIKNLSVKNFSIGIWLFYSTNNTLIDNTTSNNYTGIYISSSEGNTLTNNTAEENYWLDVDFHATTDSQCNNIIQNTVGSGGKPIKYFNSSTTLENEVLSELILCNADYSNINNVTISGSETLKNNRLIILRTDHSNITNTDSSNNFHGIILVYSSNNVLTGNIISNNDYYGIYLYYSSNNKVYNNNFIYNRWQQAYVYGGSGNIFNLEKPTGGNYWSNFDTPAEGCYDTNNDGFCNAPYYFYGGVDYLPWTRQSGWEIPADTTPPTVTVTATPDILWPPNHKMVDVRIDGSAIDDESGIASVVITVTDEYGIYDMTVPGFGSTIQLEAWREGTDRDGRVYTITVVAKDMAGNQSAAITKVIVPHDMGE